jgi:hypothetical protein
MNVLRRSAFTWIATLSLASAIGCAEGVDPARDTASTMGAGGASTGGIVGGGLVGTGLVTGGGGFSTGGIGTTTGGTPGTSGAGGTQPMNGGAPNTGGQQAAVDAGPPAIGVIVAQSETTDNATDNNLVVHVRLENRSTRTIPVSALTIRYWYTVDATPPATTDYQVMELNYADISRLDTNTHVKFSFAKMAKPQTGADHYIEVGFDGPYQLAPEPNPPAHDPNGVGSTNQIEFRTHWNDWKNYNEANDYSYDPSKTSYADANKVTVYQNGVLIWGTEPDGTKPTAPGDGGTGSDAAVPDGAPDAKSPPPADAARG